MFASLFVFALWGSLPEASTAAEPIWLSDYTQARKHGVAANKPLLVVVGSGNRGWEKVTQESAWSKEVQQLLADQYVCVYVDTEEERGKQLASALEVDGVGVVISDRGGDVQSFRHQGTLSAGDMEWYVRRYADPDHVTRYTETEQAFRVTYYYQPPAYSPPPAFNYAPVCRT